jgi:hypothetical protein
MTNKVRALAKDAWAQLKDTKGWSTQAQHASAAPLEWLSHHH